MSQTIAGALWLAWKLSIAQGRLFVQLAGKALAWVWEPGLLLPKCRRGQAGAAAAAQGSADFDMAVGGGTIGRLV